jgi:hypothetical protein
MLILTADQQVRLTVAYTDRYGNVATIDGTPRWESSDESIVTVTPGTDGSFADVVTAGPAGIAQVRAIADALPGAEERLLIALEEIQVVGGEARVVALSAGAVQPKPEPLPTDPVAADNATPAPAEEPATPDDSQG